MSSILRFTFQYGAIIMDNVGYIDECYYNLRSNMVLLLLDETTLDNIIFTLFTFQYGAIIIMLYLYLMYYYSLFTFQYGAIIIDR